MPNSPRSPKTLTPCAIPPRRIPVYRALAAPRDRSRQCRPDSSEALSHALALTEERGYGALALSMKLSRIRGFLWRGAYESVDRHLHALLPEIEALPRPDELLGQWGLLAMTLHIDKGDWKSAQDLTLHSLYKAEQAHDYYTWIQINAEAGRIALGQNRAADALSIFEGMAAESAERRFASCALICWRLLSQAQLVQGRLEPALEIAARALEIAEKPDVGNTRERYLLSLTMARILLAQGDIRAAGERLQPLWPEIKQTGFLPLIADAASAVGELYLAMANRLPEGVQRIQRQERGMQFVEIAMTQWQQLRNPYQLALASAHLSSGVA